MGVTYRIKNLVKNHVFLLLAQNFSTSQDNRVEVGKIERSADHENWDVFGYHSAGTNPLNDNGFLAEPIPLTEEWDAHYLNSGKRPEDYYPVWQERFDRLHDLITSPLTASNYPDKIKLQLLLEQEAARTAAIVHEVCWSKNPMKPSELKVGLNPHQISILHVERGDTMLVRDTSGQGGDACASR